MSCVEVRERVRDSPARAFSLFTVRAAISSARPSERPWLFSLFLTCSYCLARFVPFCTPRGGIFAPGRRLSLLKRGYPPPRIACARLDLRLENIILETDRWRIEGQLTLPAEGYRSRLSDYVNQRDREFFSIQDATLTSLDRPDEVQQMQFLMVARRHIRLIAPGTR